MLIRPSEQQILIARAARFPLPSTFSIKNAIFKNSGTDTLSEIDIFLNDSVEKPKVFKREAQKNYLKFKIFQISSQQMKNEMSEAQNIVEIENIIKKYGTISMDLFPCSDFIGSKTDENDHVVVDGNVTLDYKVNMVFPETNLTFLSLGLIFYFNLNEYITQNKVNEKFIIKEALCSNLLIVDLFDAAGKIVGKDIVQDLRTINKVFKNRDLLNKLTQQINLEQKLLKLQSQPKKQANNTQFFSSLYNSRDTDGRLNMLFLIDYKKIIENYSNFSNIVKNTPFQAEIQKNCKISSIKILKRQVEYSNDSKKRLIPKRLPVEALVSTAQNKNEKNLELIPVETDLGFIREYPIFNNFRTIEVSDKVLYKSKRSFYQYGIELNINDGFYEFLKNLKDQLSFNLRPFKNYLQETNKVIKTNSQISKNGSQKQTDIGYYDPITNSFSKFFAEEIFPLTYQEDILKSISLLVSSMNLFGMVNENTEEQSELTTSLIALANPVSATADTIIYFIKIYEKFISHIENILKSSFNTSFSLEHWFERDVIDASINPAVGYGFFQKKSDGVSKINNLDFENKISKDSVEYVRGGADTTSRDAYKYSSVAPEFINSIAKKLLLNNIATIENKQFKELELEIKRYNSLDDDRYQPILDDDLKIKDQETVISNLKTERLMSRFSFFTKNKALQLTDKQLIKQKGTNNFEKINYDIDPQILFLGMLKNTTKKPIFKSPPRSVLFNRSGFFIKKINKTYREDLPIHVFTLINKTDSIFSQTDIKYLNDLENNSKFLFLYNTIHQIEILQETSNIKEEKWALLTKEIYDSLPQNSKTFCRLKLFSDVSSEITSFEEINLPVYDKYFVLEKNISEELVARNLEIFKKTLDFSVAKLFSSVKLSLTPAIQKVSLSSLPRNNINVRNNLLGEQQQIAVTPIVKATQAIQNLGSKLASYSLSKTNQTSLSIVTPAVQNNIASTISQSATLPEDISQKKSVLQENKLKKIITSVKNIVK